MKGTLLIIVLVIVVGLGLVYMQFGDMTSEGEMTPEEAAGLGLTYIKDNLLLEGMQADLIGAVEEDYGLYKFEIDVEGQTYNSYITKDGKLLFPQGVVLEQEETETENGEELEAAEPAEELEAIGATIGDFSVYDKDVCLENGKPLVYFFGSETCPHCQWEHPVIQKAAEKFTGYIAFHDGMNLAADSPDMAVFQQYNPRGSVPTMVLGCKYGRVGSGSMSGEELEEQHLTALICDLTGGQPSAVCSEVQDLISEINQ